MNKENYMLQLRSVPELNPVHDSVIILERIEEAKAFCNNEEKLSFITREYEEKKSVVALNEFSHITYFVVLPENLKAFHQYEYLRKAGFEVYQKLGKRKRISLQVESIQNNLEFKYAFVEGFVLSSYKFDQYKTEQADQDIELSVVGAEATRLKELYNIFKANFKCRDLVNTPNCDQSADQLSAEFSKICAEAGIEIEVLGVDQIKSLKMGGLLAVNKGSDTPPTFTVMEYCPEEPVNAQPIVLVGKGVVYDTGGISLKPSVNGMLEIMKSDMAGAATVASVIYAVALNKLPLHVVTLVPATDNMPGNRAIVPGDVITMMSGTTVEVINTDAEGRLILADALHYAKRYQPELVIDVATLTGSSLMAIGREGLVYMGKVPFAYKNDLENIGREVYERVVEFPLWDEYGDQLVSEIADLKNLGGPTAGAITAGKFLQHFTDYNWLHFDIAGPAYNTGKANYRGINASGVGVRLLYHYLKAQLERE
ncbi:leucyl aminopeptidase [Limibacter armeniacum]|uniref:leucyl aminopeptidase family protein n=1 Tax=Limibacter armeniacum TaxID=466084 RepID=UPI002FE52345